MEEDSIEELFNKFKEKRSKCNLCVILYEKFMCIKMKEGELTASAYFEKTQGKYDYEAIVNTAILAIEQEYVARKFFKEQMNGNTINY